MEYLLILLVACAMMILYTIYQYKKTLAQHEAYVNELDQLARSLDRYRLVNFEKVQGVWLVYDSIKGDFLGQSDSHVGIAAVTQRRWPDKIVLGFDHDDEQVYLASAPPDTAVDDDVLPLVDK
jgi:hypothetical protein